MTPNTIEFRSTSDNTWVMRITADRKIEVNEDVDVTFAAQKVLDAMQYLLKAQRTWVDLTRTQMQDVYFAVLEEHRGGHQMEGQLAFGEALQAKIKEKNT